MKILSILIFLFLSFFSYSQHNEYKMYSDVWDYDTSLHRITPKNSESFSSMKFKLNNIIDTNKIYGFLLESFNKFRKEYGSSAVQIDTFLQSQCKTYSKNLYNSFKHDTNLPKTQSEVIAKLNHILLSNVDTTKFDINKVIADCVFDIFSSSYGHMSILLDERTPYFGFGLNFSQSTILICVRGRIN
jgi:hypothetical protein